MAPAPGLCGDPQLVALFAAYNREYFQNELRPSAGFRLRFSRGEKLFGYFAFCLNTHEDWNITVARRLQDHPRALRSTLVHEMLHMLAHQRYRTTGDEYFLDLAPAEGSPFYSRGHGGFFVGEMERLKRRFTVQGRPRRPMAAIRRFPELALSITSHYGNELYDAERIPPARLLLIHLDRKKGQGMIYRLHRDASLDWKALRQTARRVHGSDDVALLQVAGAHGEGFPALRRDNGARLNMKVRRLRNFATVVGSLLHAKGTVHLGEFPVFGRPAATALLRRAG